MDISTILIRLGFAAALCALLGLERELRLKPAGVRTNALVGLAAAAFTLIGAEAFVTGDPARVAAQIVTGVGFLGGGAIFAAGGQPHGLTTAAVLWASAAIGMAAGAGKLALAVLIVAITYAVLLPLDWVVANLPRGLRIHESLTLMLDAPGDIDRIQDIIAGLSHLQASLSLRDVGGHLIADVVVRGRQEDADVLAEAVRSGGLRLVSRSGVARS